MKLQMHRSSKKDRNRMPSQEPGTSAPSLLPARLLIALLLAWPIGLAITEAVPSLLPASHADGLFVAQVEAVLIMPLAILFLCGSSTLSRGLLATLAAFLAAFPLAFIFLAFGSP